jgi:hypothetical protein
VSSKVQILGVEYKQIIASINTKGAGRTGSKAISEDGLSNLSSDPFLV